MSEPDVGLVGDIGATNARFALIKPDGNLTPARVYALADHASLADFLMRIWPRNLYAKPS
jgi:glucokinase